MPEMQPRNKPCGLCGRSRELINSHVIPDSVLGWIKRTSATGYLRSGANPNRKVQDGIKYKLLCAECDGVKVGRLEKYFMENFFVPFLEKGIRSFEYDERLSKFASSLALRILLLEESRGESDRLNLKDFDKPKSYLQRYLNGLTKNGNGISHYIITTDSGEDVTLFKETKDNFIIQHGYPGRVAFHLMRTVDSLAFYLNDYLITLAQIPGFIFVSVIKPRIYKGNLGHKINSTSGRIDHRNGNVMSTDVFDFLIDRSRLLDELRLSENQKSKMEESILKKL